jgi:hypothetical protein
VAKKKPQKLLTASSQPRGPGYPTKYKPEYCQALIDHMSNGDCFLSFCAKIGIARGNAYEWVKLYPEFKEAKEIAFTKCETWWRAQAKEHLVEVTEYDDKGRPIRASKINTSLWIFNMKNRFKWRDLQEVESNVKQETTVKIADKEDIKAIIMAALNERKS